MTVDEHTFAVVQAAADAGTPLRVRLATLLHDLGKPGPGRRRPRRGRGEARDTASSAVCATRTTCASGSCGSCAPRLPPRRGRCRARRAACSRGTATGSPSTCSTTGTPTSAGAISPSASPSGSSGWRVFRERRRAGARSPHRLSDLAVDGTDLIGIGYEPGPALGRALQTLLDEVVDRPGAQPARAAARARRGAAARMIRWDAPGPYVVAFTTREGGVSTGALRVAQPRQPGGRSRRGSPRTAASPAPSSASTPAGSRSTGSGTPRGPRARRARPARSETRSGPTSPACRCSRLPPTASRSRSRRTDGRPALAVVHAGWRGLAAGVVRRRRRALSEPGRRRRSSGRRSGRAATRSVPRWPERFDADLTRDGILDLWTAAERALRAGRRGGRSSGSTSAPGAIPTGSSRTAQRARGTVRRGSSVLSPAEVSERYDRVRAEVGAGRDGGRRDEVRDASPTWPCSSRPAIEVVGENRAQDLEAKHAVYGDAFRWHFIGRLQSNKVKVVNRVCELVHSLDSHSARPRGSRSRRSLQVNLAGEASKGGSRARARSAATSATTCAGSRRCRPAGDPEGSRPWFRRLRELAVEHSARASFRWGRRRTTAVAAEEGATMIRVGSVLFR